MMKVVIKLSKKGEVVVLPILHLISLICFLAEVEVCYIVMVAVYML